MPSDHNDPYRIGGPPYSAPPAPARRFACIAYDGQVLSGSIEGSAR